MKTGRCRKITITVCIGSGCHVKGSRKVIKRIQEYLEENECDVDIELKACFCQNRCTEGVVVKFDDEIVTKITKDNIIDVLEEKLSCGG
ncbi:NAD(P)H-dependent oxidoreductase subunit E [Halothermothrix orenii]|uniref:NAD(P)H-dependent oxidoreductase subunit E n=1 Tax=Halothermothrix orenii TaxID=31909 RepID=UPI000A00C1A8